MSADLLGIPAVAALGAAAVTLFASFVKGAIGFAFPMIMISGLSSFLPAETALAILIVPTVATNLAQSLRQGWGPARETARLYWRLLVTLVVMIALCAQLVPLLPQRLLFAILGLAIAVFTATQLLGIQLAFAPARRRTAELVTGTVCGIFGGISGVWGPPLIAFLLSIGADKRESVRVQGVVYLIGAVMLFVAHLRSGVLDARTLPLSAAMLLPAGLGLWVGFALQDRLPPARFRRATLAVLFVAGLNLLRRALLG